MGDSNLPLYDIPRAADAPAPRPSLAGMAEAYALLNDPPSAPIPPESTLARNPVETPDALAPLREWQSLLGELRDRVAASLTEGTELRALVLRREEELMDVRCMVDELRDQRDQAAYIGQRLTVSEGAIGRLCTENARIMAQSTALENRLAKAEVAVARNERQLHEAERTLTSLLADSEAWKGRITAAAEALTRTS